MSDVSKGFDFFSVGNSSLPKPGELSSLSLAYIGDAVWEMIVRRHLLVSKESRPDRLHKAATSYVRATTQAKLTRFLESVLTDEESMMFRRGRNAKAGHQPKNADITDYRQSSGFEAIFGYLYITAQYGRIQELADLCIPEAERMIQLEGKKTDFVSKKY